MLLKLNYQFINFSIIVKVHITEASTVQQWFSNWGTRVICDTLTKKL